MQTEVTKSQLPKVEEQLPEAAAKSVCKTYEDQIRLKKLFEILMEIDKKLAKKHEDGIRSTNYTSQAK